MRSPAESRAYTSSTADADFYGEGADAALLDLSAGVTADMLFDGGAVRGDGKIQTFCNNCHRRAGAPDDYLMFVPLPYRVTANPGR